MTRLSQDGANPPRALERYYTARVPIEPTLMRPMAARSSRCFGYTPANADAQGLSKPEQLHLARSKGRDPVGIT
jgi:hypothetical protein